MTDQNTVLPSRKHHAVTYQAAVQWLLGQGNWGPPGCEDCPAAGACAAHSGQPAVCSLL